MEAVEYLNEHLAYGIAGRAAVVLAFVAALVATYAGYRATQAQRRGARAGAEVPRDASGWSRLTGGAFGVMGVAIAAVIALLLTMMTQHFYEYQYVQQHVNDALAFEYVFTAFWEGQEGSFLLWLIWHAVLGGVVWYTAGRWRLPVVTVIASVQVVLTSMLLGVYLPWGEAARVGSSPFNLLREVMAAPIFGQADYVSLIEGTGLNPLLQNYWMLIHPPTLFLGFASTVVPFAFAMAGLWLREHRAWLDPALKWALFSAGILGVGILMGGAWAYEALNFGGYWAWDPVENTSLVPWLLIVAGIHTTLIARATGHSIRSSYAFYALGFVGILYSSLLTRSGLLGETSVHAFTEMGLEAQLILLVGTFTLLGVGLLAARWREIPAKQKEEALDSREFWMFLGSLVLLFSAGMITVSTSLPVINKLGDALGLDFGHLTIKEPVEHYNKYQLWVGVFMALFTGLAHYFRWRRGGRVAGGGRGLGIRLGAAALLSAALAGVTYQALSAEGVGFVLLAFGAYFALVSNLDYLFTSRVALWQRAAGFAAHAGFAMLLIGVLFSGLNKHHISQNTFAMDGLLGEEQIGKNVLLVRGLPMVINGYEVTYLSDTLVGNRRDFAIQYRELGRDGSIGDSFVLRPYALYTNDFAKVASMNPDTKHYWDHDVFTHITGLPPGNQSAEQAKAYEDSLAFTELRVPLGDSALAERHRVTLVSLTDAPQHPDYEPEPGDLALGARVRIDRLAFDTTEYAEPVVVLRENLVYSYPAQVNPLSVRVQLPESAFAVRYASDAELDYKRFDLAPGGYYQLGDYRFTFERFDRAGEHPGYVAEEGNVAVNAVVSVRDASGEVVSELRPLYYIRGSSPMVLKSVDTERGLHVQLAGIDPADGTAELAFAVSTPPADAAFPIEIAENASRTDWVVLEATVFPGINLFWAGSILMLAGFFIALGFRLSRRVGLSPKPVTRPSRTEAPPRRSTVPEERELVA